jgi:hypothetical protein
MGGNESTTGRPAAVLNFRSACTSNPQLDFTKERG